MNSIAIRRAMAALLVLASFHVQAQIRLFQDDNFSGREFGARYEVSNLESDGFNDRASSIIVDRGAWLVCSDADYRGRCQTLQPGRYPSLRALGLNDQVSSIRPAGRPGGRDGLVLFRDDNFSGEAYEINGDESDLGRSGFNDRASSVIVSSGQWELCTDAGFRGRCETLYPGRYSSLRAMGINDAVSSVRRAGRGSDHHRHDSREGYDDSRDPRGY